jgi:4-hydroxy-2-oxoheptanedioate aldolase
VTPDDVRGTWAEGGVTLGMWTAIPDPFALELTAHADLTYICLDQQHGLIDYGDLVALLPVVERHGILPITRVPANEPWLIGRSLDAGAMGIVVPMVSTAQEAAAAVSACRYAPNGVRSFGPIRASLAAGTNDPRRLESVLCIVMVETMEGLRNLPEIVATPGVDAVYVGPADLALSLGVTPKLEATDAAHAQAIEAIRRACRDGGIAAGIQCNDGEHARREIEAGFQMVTIGKDSGLLKAAVQQQVRAAQGVSTRDSAIAYT